ncbi:MAG: hypothetical protein PF482_03445 [Desulfobacteraceae bacterium]|jgi:hypothetical protein|nr:hypothetical protein [Desulfobacteraceae bacterium]
MKKIMVILIGLMVMAATIAFAGEMNIDAILGGAEASSPMNWDSDMPVWQVGTIDAIGPKGMVTDDVGYRWSKFGTRYYDKDGSILTSGDFKQGTTVTIVLDTDRKTILAVIKGAIENNQEDNE